MIHYPFNILVRVKQLAYMHGANSLFLDTLHTGGLGRLNEQEQDYERPDLLLLFKVMYGRDLVVRS